MLLNFQTMIMDLTGLEYANALLLDEATAAAEAMSLTHGNFNGKRAKFFVDQDAHPQTIGMMHTRSHLRQHLFPFELLTNRVDRDQHCKRPPPTDTLLFLSYISFF